MDNNTCGTFKLGVSLGNAYTVYKELFKAVKDKK